MTAEERSDKFSSDIDAIERMTPDECRAELRRMATERSFLGTVAATALIADNETRR